jgi:hypothetical protein
MENTTKIEALIKDADDVSDILFDLVSEGHSFSEAISIFNHGVISIIRETPKGGLPEVPTSVLECIMKEGDVMAGLVRHTAIIAVSAETAMGAAAA